MEILKYSQNATRQYQTLFYLSVIITYSDIHQLEVEVVSR